MAFQVEWSSPNHKIHHQNKHNYKSTQEIDNVINSNKWLMLIPQFHANIITK